MMNKSNVKTNLNRFEFIPIWVFVFFHFTFILHSNVCSKKSFTCTNKWNQMHLKANRKNILLFIFYSFFQFVRRKIIWMQNIVDCKRLVFFSVYFDGLNWFHLFSFFSSFEFVAHRIRELFETVHATRFTVMVQS